MEYYTRKLKEKLSRGGHYYEIQMFNLWTHL